MSAKKKSELYLKLKEYVENRPVAIKASKPLKDGACCGVTFGEEPKVWYHYIRECGQGYLREGKPEQSDFDLHIPVGGVEELVSFKSEKIPDIGGIIFERAVMDDEKQRLRVTMHKGPLKLTRLGYLSVVGKGGFAVFRIIRKHGLLDIAKARKIFTFSDKFEE